MPEVTYCVVLPFRKLADGDWLYDEAVQAQNRDHALRLARRLAEKGGAIAFSRTGDPETGEFADALILGVFGEVPAEAMAA
jgi:hypothetical protein